MAPPAEVSVQQEGLAIRFSINNTFTATEQPHIRTTPLLVPAVLFNHLRV